MYTYNEMTNMTKMTPPKQELPFNPDEAKFYDNRMNEHNNEIKFYELMKDDTVEVYEMILDKAQTGKRFIKSKEQDSINFINDYWSTYKYNKYCGVLMGNYFDKISQDDIEPLHKKNGCVQQVSIYSEIIDDLNDMIEITQENTLKLDKFLMEEIQFMRDDRLKEIESEQKEQKPEVVEELKKYSEHCDRSKERNRENMNNIFNIKQGVYDDMRVLKKVINMMENNNVKSEPKIMNYFLNEMIDERNFTSSYKYNEIVNECGTYRPMTPRYMENWLLFTRDCLNCILLSYEKELSKEKDEALEEYEYCTLLKNDDKKKMVIRFIEESEELWNEFMTKDIIECELNIIKSRNLDDRQSEIEIKKMYNKHRNSNVGEMIKSTNLMIKKLNEKEDKNYLHFLKHKGQEYGAIAQKLEKEGIQMRDIIYAEQQEEKQEEEESDILTGYERKVVKKVCPKLSMEKQMKKKQEVEKVMNAVQLSINMADYRNINDMEVQLRGTLELINDIRKKKYIKGIEWYGGYMEGVLVYLNDCNKKLQNIDKDLEMKIYRNSRKLGQEPNSELSLSFLEHRLKEENSCSTYYESEPYQNRRKLRSEMYHHQEKVEYYLDLLKYTGYMTERKVGFRKKGQEQIIRSIWMMGKCCSQYVRMSNFPYIQDQLNQSITNFVKGESIDKKYKLDKWIEYFSAISECIDVEYEEKIVKVEKKETEERKERIRKIKLEITYKKNYM